MRSFTEIRRGGFLRSLAKSAICCAVIVSLSTVAGCSDDYDDSQLRGDLSELSGRVEKLEQSVAKLNGDYTALSGIVDALEGKVYVSKVDPIADGYRITFSDGTTAEIKNGAAGAAAPVIGIDKDTDGLYYWTRTIDGKTEWLLNEENEKMPVSGVTPVMGVDAEGYWTISYDGGTTSSRVVDSEGNPVAALQDTSFFESVTYDDSYVYITLNDEAGTVIKLAKGADFYLSIKGAAALADFSYGQTKSFEVESKGVIKYTITKPDEWKVAYADGKLTVTAPTAEHASCADSEGEVSIVYFGPDNAGSITTLRVAVLEAPKIGDYLYSDGTWSDGGLISIGSDGLNPVWAEEKPAPVEGKSVVAIVCQTASDRIAQSEKDAGYTHGYAVAVRSAHGTDKVTTWWSSDVNFDCLKGAKLPSTWYENVNGYVETMTRYLRFQYHDDAGFRLDDQRFRLDCTCDDQRLVPAQYRPVVGYDRQSLRRRCGFDHERVADVDLSRGLWILQCNGRLRCAGTFQFHDGEDSGRCERGVGRRRCGTSLLLDLGFDTVRFRSGLYRRDRYEGYDRVVYQLV